MIFNFTFGCAVSVAVCGFLSLWPVGAALVADRGL